MTPRRLGQVGLGLAFLVTSLMVQARENKAQGQVLYVPVYSEISYGDKKLSINLAVTLSIRNTDHQKPIVLKRVEYFSSDGKLVRAYLKHTINLKPMASIEHIVKTSDRSGGISASFVVEWESEVPVYLPLVEAVMVNSTYNHGIAFNSQARVLDEKP